jgi:hypothetical protein
MRSFYRRVIMVVFDMMGRVDVVAVIEEVHAVEGHSSS